jgi:4-diphosphocytidyl-2-C-methyl-D-erythritol kinase
LRALADLFPHAVAAPSESALVDLAAQLGSDVPLFLAPADASLLRMRGRGEIIEPVTPPLPRLFGVLVRPNASVPTGPAYALLDARPGRVPGAATRAFIEALTARARNAEKLAPLLANDFEQAILPAYPAVAGAHRAVTEAGALRALLCGSGSAVFGLARDHAHARALCRALCGRFPWVKLARSLEPAGADA